MPLHYNPPRNSLDCSLLYISFSFQDFQNKVSKLTVRPKTAESKLATTCSVHTRIILVASELEVAGTETTSSAVCFVGTTKSVLRTFKIPKSVFVF